MTVGRTKRGREPDPSTAKPSQAQIAARIAEEMNPLLQQQILHQIDDIEELQRRFPALSAETQAAAAALFAMKRLVKEELKELERRIGDKGYQAEWSPFISESRRLGLTELGRFIFAIQTGTDHPLLDFWKISRPPHRPPPSFEMLQWRRFAVVAVRAMMLSAEGMSQKQARECVSRCFRDAGVFPRCEATTLRNWCDDHWHSVSADAEEFASHYDRDRTAILQGVRDNLVSAPRRMQ